ncbi:hypothetical protein N836_31425 [Leptolyngbya sp. Heron Island J]|uniref:hypothetical protein n=1 Tax=Leptolyngbya sp. Heron Island J TaxID=1385935 RepID=UPI0003B94A06|nr:hypothetical protein [Leptolyngbya sp. Heron Island J]ESA38453.1 hypothetical protein N836_31425 [Leptolyngbya sp. Heron Island J]
MKNPIFLFLSLTLIIPALTPPVLAKGAGNTGRPHRIETTNNDNGTVTTTTDSPESSTTTTQDSRGNELRCEAARDESGDIVWPWDCDASGPDFE